jgi:hypothetical protein
MSTISRCVGGVEKHRFGGGEKHRFVRRGPLGLLLRFCGGDGHAGIEAQGQRQRLGGQAIGSTPYWALHGGELQNQVGLMVSQGVLALAHVAAWAAAACIGLAVGEEALVG